MHYVCLNYLGQYDFPSIQSGSGYYKSRALIVNYLKFVPVNNIRIALFTVSCSS